MKRTYQQAASIAHLSVIRQRRYSLLSLIWPWLHLSRKDQETVIRLIRYLSGISHT